MRSNAYAPFKLRCSAGGSRAGARKRRQSQQQAGSHREHGMAGVASLARPARLARSLVGGTHPSCLSPLGGWSPGRRGGPPRGQERQERGCLTGTPRSCQGASGMVAPPSGGLALTHKYKGSGLPPPKFRSICNFESLPCHTQTLASSPTRTLRHLSSD
jgi:hypothetical protein